MTTWGNVKLQQLAFVDLCCYNNRLQLVSRSSLAERVAIERKKRMDTARHLN